jgi:RimJ/RimL family protein N-acetyltransferase
MKAMSTTIKTDRLLLRSLEPGDLPRLVALVNNWNVVSMLSRVRFPYDHADGEAFLGLLAENPQERAFAIIAEAGFIGCVGLHPDGAGGTEIGYWLGEPYWGQGYATEAGRALIGFSFAELNLPFVTSGYFVVNPASGRVLEKLGFRYIGGGERVCLARGCKVESREMILERTDWQNG